MIRFRFQPTFEDYSALNRFVIWRQLRYLIVIAGMLVVLFALQPVTLGSMGGSRSASEVYRSSLGILILPGLVTFLLIVSYIAVRKGWNAAEELRIEREYEIDDIGVRVTGSSLSGFLEWRHFIKADRQSGYYFIKTAQSQFHYFPELVVPDQQALNELIARKMLETNRVKPAKKSRLILWLWLAIILAIVILYFANPSRG
ncbi:MAG: hypothetical protein ABI273_05290 [Lacunisphaera sp.]